MTQLLHTGDTHLGYRQYHSPVRREDFLAAFERVVADAVEAEVDAVVHAGDLFQDRQPALTDVMGALSVLRRLDDAGIPFYGVVGNHESKRDSQWLDLFERLGVATRLGAEPVVVGDVALYGLDFVPRSRREALDYEFDPAPPAAAHTALVSHGLFEPFEHGDWDTRRLLDESPVAFDALLLGDDHTPRTRRFEAFDTWLTYPGSTERASASERDDRGYNLVQFDDGLDIRRRGLDTRRFVYVDVELEPGEGTGRVLERLRQYSFEDAVVIVTLTGDGERVTPAEVEADATERGALVARVNDRRDHDEESAETDVSFANPDRAVERRVRDLGLSTAARELDELVRTGRVADANVADAAEERVREFAEDAEPDLFEPADTSDGTDTDDGSTEDTGPVGGVTDDGSAEDAGSVGGVTDDGSTEDAESADGTVTDGEVAAGGGPGRGADTRSDRPERDTDDDDGQIQLGDYS
jgi:DNA repair exonuclease SbcCD nuclease subunit